MKRKCVWTTVTNFSQARKSKQKVLTNKNNNKDAKKNPKEVTENVHEDDGGQSYLKKTMF